MADIHFRGDENALPRKGISAKILYPLFYRLEAEAKSRGKSQQSKVIEAAVEFYLDHLEKGEVK